MNIILVKNPKTGQLEPIHAIKGASAYEIAVKNGFEGTEQEWLDSLKGAPYVPTEADKTELVSAVLDRIPIYMGEVEDL